MDNFIGSSKVGVFFEEWFDIFLLRGFELCGWVFSYLIKKRVKMLVFL